ncbi:putative PEP-CTERM system TPR-repeat lipoprotein [Luteitalea pratensis]|uniref:Putative PEP-CTERM system TPR-repeat lipoprotein n=1 Tax=Luteitalea pratensis TaxID=1855912 RepID=A0A143PWB7_LUTPR|nr:tetratricopeptide repeat protein [Luteitalea pratensis]AMY12340.1 putative PEP-CTERM system TPR-repeat lipoprotein [Luteitalea pratensis]
MSRSTRQRRSVAPPAAPEAQGTYRWRWPLILLGLVLALKTALALTLAGHPLLQPEGELDAGEYWRLAQRVVAGDVLLTGTSFYVSPLYIYWLAFAQAMTGARVAGVLVLQAGLGTLAVWLTARTAALWVADDMRVRAAVVAGGALALTGIVALQEALILQAALDAMLMSAFAYGCSRALQEPSARRWACSGIILALLATNRPNAWLLGVILLLGAWRRGGVLQERGDRLRAATAVALGALVVLAPFTVRSRIATGAWQVLPGHGGLNFYIGNHAAANGTYTVVDGVRPSIAGQRDDMRRVAEQAAGRPLSDAAVSSHFVRQSLAWWRRAPVDAIGLFAYKLWLTTHAWELPVNVSYAWFREQVLLLTFLPVGAWLLVPLGLAAAIGGHVAVPVLHQGAWRWFRWLLPAYLVSVAIFFVVDRYRAPALVFGAISVGILASMWRSSDQPPEISGAFAAMAVAGVVLAAGLVPLPFHLGEADADTRMALHAIDSGRDAEGRAWLDRAVARHPAPGVAWFRAGLAWQARNQLADAERALREAHRLDPDVSDVAFALGEVLISEGKGAEAVPLLEQAERGGVRPDRARLDLALARWQAGDEPGARATLAAGVPPEALPLLRARALASVEAGRVNLAAWLLTEHRRYVRDDAEVTEKLGLMMARGGDVTAAAALFEEALRLDASDATARFNLAIARVQQGRRLEAIALLREALRIDPTYAQAAGALRELLAAQ